MPEQAPHTPEIEDTHEVIPPRRGKMVGVESGFHSAPDEVIIEPESGPADSQHDMPEEDEVIANEIYKFDQFPEKDQEALLKGEYVDLPVAMSAEEFDRFMDEQLRKEHPDLFARDSLVTHLKSRKE